MLLNNNRLRMVSKDHPDAETIRFRHYSDGSCDMISIDGKTFYGHMSNEQLRPAPDRKISFEFIGLFVVPIAVLGLSIWALAAYGLVCLIRNW